MKCPNCNQIIEVFQAAGRKGGSSRSEAKRKSSALNGRLGGRPKGSKNKPKLEETANEKQ